MKVSVWRADGADVMKRVLEESLAGRFLADVVESTEANIGGLHKRQLLQEHHSPELRFFKDEVVAKGKRGVFYWADRETYISLGFNTNHLSIEEAPKSTQDLLDAKFKGKISLAGGATAARWVGAVIDVDSLVPQKFKKTYLEAKYPLDEYEKKLDEWEELIQRLFIRKR